MDEACPRCGAVQVRYQGRVYCTREDDLSAILSPRGSRAETAHSGVSPASPNGHSKHSSSMGAEQKALRNLLEEKLAKVTKELETSQDLDQQAKLLDLVSKYLETLEKLKRNEGS
jgi:uncharacterized Zn finger protein (UPF0148 family)